MHKSPPPDLLDSRQKQNKGRGLARRNIILLRAGELFDEKGVSHTSIEEIARAAGIAREAVYYYFADKTDILIEIMLPESVSLDTGLKRIVGLDTPAKDKLILAIENHLYRFNPNYFEMVMTVQRAGKSKPDDRIQNLLEVWRTYQNRWIDLIQEGQESGEIPDYFDPKIAAFAILGVCNSPSTWFRPANPHSIEYLAENLVNLVLNGMIARP